ncbi:hypothetical protein HK102_005664, partial [Quaeritorhiza haematococci]
MSEQFKPLLTGRLAPSSSSLSSPVSAFNSPPTSPPAFPSLLNGSNSSLRSSVGKGNENTPGSTQDSPSARGAGRVASGGGVTVTGSGGRGSGNVGPLDGVGEETYGVGPGTTRATVGGLGPTVSGGVGGDQSALAIVHYGTLTRYSAPSSFSWLTNLTSGNPKMYCVLTQQQLLWFRGPERADQFLGPSMLSQSLADGANVAAGGAGGKDTSSPNILFSLDQVIGCCHEAFKDRGSTWPHNNIFRVHLVDWNRKAYASLCLIAEDAISAARWVEVLHQTSADFVSRTATTVAASALAVTSPSSFSVRNQTALSTNVMPPASSLSSSPPGKKKSKKRTGSLTKEELRGIMMSGASPSTMFQSSGSGAEGGYGLHRPLVDISTHMVRMAPFPTEAEKEECWRTLITDDEVPLFCSSPQDLFIRRVVIQQRRSNRATSGGGGLSGSSGPNNGSDDDDDALDDAYDVRDGPTSPGTPTKGSTSGTSGTTNTAKPTGPSTVTYGAALLCIGRTVVRFFPCGISKCNYSQVINLIPSPLALPVVGIKRLCTEGRDSSFSIEFRRKGPLWTMRERMVVLELVSLQRDNVIAELRAYIAGLKLHFPESELYTLDVPYGLRMAQLVPRHIVSFDGPNVEEPAPSSSAAFDKGLAVLFQANSYLFHLTRCSVHYRLTPHRSSTSSTANRNKRLYTISILPSKFHNVRRSPALYNPMELATVFEALKYNPGIRGISFHGIPLRSLVKAEPAGGIHPNPVLATVHWMPTGLLSRFMTAANTGARHDSQDSIEQHPHKMFGDPTANELAMSNPGSARGGETIITHAGSGGNTTSMVTNPDTSIFGPFYQTQLSTLIYDLITTNPQLESLNLIGCQIEGPLSSNTVSPMCALGRAMLTMCDPSMPPSIRMHQQQQIQNITQIRTLQLSQNKFAHDRDVLDLALAIAFPSPSRPSLRKLALAHCGINSHLNVIVRALILKDPSTLEHLDLSYNPCPIDPHSLALLLRKATSLKRLILAGCTFALLLPTLNGGRVQEHQEKDDDPTQDSTDSFVELCKLVVDCSGGEQQLKPQPQRATSPIFSFSTYQPPQRQSSLLASPLINSDTSGTQSPRTGTVNNTSRTTSSSSQPPPRAKQVYVPPPPPPIFPLSTSFLTKLVLTNTILRQLSVNSLCEFIASGICTLVELRVDGTGLTGGLLASILEAFSGRKCDRGSGMRQGSGKGEVVRSEPPSTSANIHDGEGDGNVRTTSSMSVQPTEETEETEELPSPPKTCRNATIWAGANPLADSGWERFCYALSEGEGPRNLSLENTELTDAQLTQLLTCLTTNTNLATLDLSYIKIREEETRGAGAFDGMDGFDMEVVEGNQDADGVDVRRLHGSTRGNAPLLSFPERTNSGNNSGTADIRSPARSAVTSPANNTPDRTTPSSRPASGSVGTAATTGVTRVNLASIDACNALGAMFSLNSTLRELIMRGRSDAQWGPNLQVAFRMLRVNQSLAGLDVRGNGFGDAGAVSIADALRQNRGLRSLEIDDNDITTHGLLVLQSAVRHNPILVHCPAPKNDIAKQLGVLKSHLKHIKERRVRLQSMPNKNTPSDLGFVGGGLVANIGMGIGGPIGLPSYQPPPPMSSLLPTSPQHAAGNTVSRTQPSSPLVVIPPPVQCPAALQQQIQQRQAAAADAATFSPGSLISTMIIASQQQTHHVPTFLALPQQAQQQPLVPSPFGQSMPLSTMFTSGAGAASSSAPLSSSPPMWTNAGLANPILGTSPRGGSGGVALSTSPPQQHSPPQHAQHLSPQPQPSQPDLVTSVSLYERQVSRLIDQIQSLPIRFEESVERNRRTLEVEREGLKRRVEIERAVRGLVGRNESLKTTIKRWVRAMRETVSEMEKENIHDASSSAAVSPSPHIPSSTFVPHPSSSSWSGTNSDGLAGPMSGSATRPLTESDLDTLESFASSSALIWEHPWTAEILSNASSSSASLGGSAKAEGKRKSTYFPPLPTGK